MFWRPCFSKSCPQVLTESVLSIEVDLGGTSSFRSFTCLENVRPHVCLSCSHGKQLLTFPEHVLWCQALLCSLSGLSYFILTTAVKSRQSTTVIFILHRKQRRVKKLSDLSKVTQILVQGHMVWCAQGSGEFDPEPAHDEPLPHRWVRSFRMLLEASWTYTGKKANVTVKDRGVLILSKSDTVAVKPLPLAAWTYHLSQYMYWKLE